MDKLYNTFKGKTVVTNVMNKCAMSVAAKTMNRTCWDFMHQPKVPQEAKMLRKF